MMRPVCVLAMVLASCSVFASGAARSATDVERAAAIDGLFAEYTRAGSPGGAVGVYSKGRVLYAKGYGLADLEAGIPITPQTQFHVASVSKQFTAYAIALLVQEGRIDLDADIRKYLPDTPDFGHVVTVRQLVHHTSGIRDYSSLLGLGGRDLRDLLPQQKIVNLLQRQRALNFAPGTDFLYGNSGYVLLAEIVRSVTGKTLRQFTTERMFTPLKMSRTFFMDDIGELVPGRAHSYELDDDGTWQRFPLNYESVGSTGLLTTVEDLAQWAGNLSAPKLGNAKLTSLISASGKLTDGTPVHYAFGLFDLPQAGRTALSHSGYDAAFCAHVTYYPEHDFAVAVLANTGMDVDAKVNAIANLYLPAVTAGASEPAVLQSPKASSLDALSGTFFAPDHPAMSFRRDGNRLIAERGTRGDGTSVVFRRDGSFDVDARNREYFRPVLIDGVTAIDRIPNGPLPAQRYRRIEPVSSTPEQLTKLAGDYRSEELDVTYTFTVRNQRLVVDCFWCAQPVGLTQVTSDHFDAPKSFAARAFSFVRNARGEVVEVRMHSDRAYGVVLRRIAPGAR
ncbi:serine hydrolase domain-containing protein [Steroidobacter sp.]|uniref:serine hydrolase domain-containing protein n=1 Tax=Steroidobacter sp. TaxID=1978227 RepID=UPI001A6186BE|nr:serine hydrolase domain-containing protein [Steroidobacter sp.]MBL8271110.1 beta-lactamase family protein [Steroidobacter sp.]